MTFARLLWSHPRPPPIRLQTMHGGEPTAYFGERSLLKSAAAVASVVATAESELLCLAKGSFEKLLMHGTERELIKSQVDERDAELREASRPPRVPWDALELRAVLGIGSFGCVRLAVHRTNGTAYALKGLHKGHLIATKQVDNVINEKRLLMACAHPFIMRCYDSYVTRTHVHLLLGIAVGGELFTYLQKVRPLPPPTAPSYNAPLPQRPPCLPPLVPCGSDHRFVRCVDCPRARVLCTSLKSPLPLVSLARAGLPIATSSSRTSSLTPPAISSSSTLDLQR